MKFFYTVSSVQLQYPRAKKPMASQIDYFFHSVESLREVMGTEPEIVLYYTPPHTDEDMDRLKAFSPVVRESRIPYPPGGSHRRRFTPYNLLNDRIMNRAYISEIDDTIVFSPDTDIKYKKDPRGLLDENYDVIAYIGRYDDAPPFISLRFLIFQNSSHKGIGDKWEYYFTSQESKTYRDIDRSMLAAINSLGLTIKEMDNPGQDNDWVIHGRFLE